MSAMGEVHGQDLVAWVHERRVGGLVGLASRVGLHVDVLGPEEPLRPLDGEVLDLVYLLAAAVVALARIAFSILVRKDGALGCQDSGRGEVLACDQLDSRALAFQFAVERLLDFRIHGLGVRSDQDLPPIRVREVPGATPGKMVVERSCGASISPRPPYQPCNCTEYRRSSGACQRASTSACQHATASAGQQFSFFGRQATRTLVAAFEVARGPGEGELLLF